MGFNKVMGWLIYIIIGIMSSIINLYLSYLVILHVQGTELMWFLFWFNIPFIVILGVLGGILKAISDEKEEVKI